MTNRRAGRSPYGDQEPPLVE